MTERKCTGCGKIQNRETMIKLTKDFSTGEVVINKDSKKFGRSAYICYNKSCVEMAFKKNKIGKALKCNISEELKGNIINEF